MQLRPALGSDPEWEDIVAPRHEVDVEFPCGTVTCVSEWYKQALFNLFFSDADTTLCSAAPPANLAGPQAHGLRPRKLSFSHGHSQKLPFVSSFHIEIDPPPSSQQTETSSS